MKIAARILLVFEILIAVFAFFILGDKTTATSCTSVVWTLSTAIFWIPFLVIIVAYIGSCLWLLRRAPLPTAFGLFFVALFLCLIVLSGSSGGRCVPPDARARIEINSLQPGLAHIKQTQGAYPETLADAGGFPVLTRSLTYERTTDSYQLCAVFKTHYFFGIQINSGTRTCYGPNDKVL